MKFFYVWSGKKLKEISIIIAAAFFTAGILFIENSERAVFSTPGGPQAIHKANINEKKVALTFNISWGDKKAIPILDILKQNKVTATFFLSAPWAKAHPDIIKRIVDDGHEIGNHGYRYESYPQLQNEQIIKEIRTSHYILSELTGKKLKYLRPPNGHFDKRTLKIANQLGYSIIHWSIDANDYENPGVEVIVNNVVNNVSNGDIILMHASDSVKQTQKALPIILKQLKNEGYQFVTISELIASTNAKSEEIK